jgi:YARHG domain-containing protein/TIR domain-containing protein
MAMIMISYRRVDQAMAGRIADYLVAKYGEKSVFFDVNSIRTGANFHDGIAKAIMGSDVVIAVVGPNWLGKAKNGRSVRLGDPADSVRVEIETALKCNKPILPLLVNGAEMPLESELPDALRGLHAFNASKVDSGQDFRIHMGRLVDTINEVVNETGRPLLTIPDPAHWQPGRSLVYAAAASVAGAVALLALLWAGAPAWEWSLTKLLIPAGRAIPADPTPQISTTIAARAKAHGGFIFPDSDQRLLGDEELKGLSAIELRVARNEIYARHGRFFVDARLVNYFSQFAWYHPRQVEVELSSLETSNVNTIQSAESRR